MTADVTYRLAEVSGASFGVRPRAAESKRRRGLRAVCMIAPLAWCIAGALHAQQAPGFPYTQNDFGEVGLLQTPSARMADDGEVGLSWNRVDPYSRINAFAQPFPWLEAVARYTIVSNRPYDPALPGSQSYKDKSIDVKLRLLEESHFLPAVAVGIRDIAGTGFFSGEYVVGSKRWGNFDFSLGLGWGNVGGRGNLPNPLGWIDSGFDHRPTSRPGAVTGKFTASRYFRGPTALFGGVEYQTPLPWLRLKAELDGNDYQHEAQANNQQQRWPINLGALFRVNGNVDVTLGYERGTTYMATVTLHDNIGRRVAAAKPLDPPPEPIAATAADASPPSATSPSAGAAPVAARTSTARADWLAISRVLEKNAGIKVERIAQRGSELLVYGEQTRFFYGSEGLGRAARILDNRIDASIDWITFVPETHGLAIVENSVHRPRFTAYLRHDIDLPALRRSVEQDPTAAQAEQVLYRTPLKRFEFSLGPGLAQNFGSPSKPVVFQLTANGNATVNFTRNLWLDAQVDVNILNNFSSTPYVPPSRLPRVRTYYFNYLQDSNVTVPLFQLTGTRQLGTDLYGMAYAGLFEPMFGGVGGEVLYRPLHQRWALGVDANYVRQRGFKQNFSFRNYHVATGLATFYYDTGWHGLQTNVSVGRYLAGDWGGTFDVSRHFANGVRMGAWATLTTAGSRYGEGSFDKGVYLSIPFDLLLPISRSRSANLVWQPLLRDGGARLSKPYNLYDMTADRDSDLFDANLGKISQ